MPKLATGEMKGAYALTEPGSGSDALAAKTTAKLSDDGKSYLLNGQRYGSPMRASPMCSRIRQDRWYPSSAPLSWIAIRPGLSFGEEEHKMGIKGSSTRQLFFENCAVPKENLLGEPGKGHIIAFNILNIGRLSCVQRRPAARSSR
jgi:alkylation response protein AidB-like acyl-CoA dehydrogenase